MYIKENYPGQRIYCMGTRSLIRELFQEGIDVVTEVDDQASIVLIGFDTENTSEKVRKTCIMLGKDVVYLATNLTWYVPSASAIFPTVGL